MHQRVSSAPLSLAVSGKALSESRISSRSSKVLGAVAPSPRSGAATTEKGSHGAKRRPTSSRSGPHGTQSCQEGGVSGHVSNTHYPTAAAGSSHAQVHGSSHLSQLSTRSTAVEVSLVHNLKKQIACLETQLRVLKLQQDGGSRAEHHSGSASNSGEVRDVSRAGATRPESFELSQSLPQCSPLADPSAEVVKVAKSTDEDVVRMRQIPEAYQTERSALLHNIESLTKDVEGLQSQVLHIGRQRDSVVAEAADLRAALKEAKVENDSMAAELAATLKLLETEQALRRAAEDSARLTKPSFSSHDRSICLSDAISQRDYYKLQAERATGALAREKARSQALSNALQRDSEAVKILETQLCDALDRIAFMQRHEGALNLYNQQLRDRFVTISATLRHVIDVIPPEVLQRRRVPSPESRRVGQSETPEMTMKELCNTLDAWHKEASSDVRQVPNAADVVQEDALVAATATTERVHAATSGGDVELLADSSDATGVAPPTVCDVGQVNVVCRAFSPTCVLVTEDSLANSLPTEAPLVEDAGDAVWPNSGGDTAYQKTEPGGTLGEGQHSIRHATEMQLQEEVALAESLAHSRNSLEDCLTPSGKKVPMCDSPLTRKEHAATAEIVQSEAAHLATGTEAKTMLPSVAPHEAPTILEASTPETAVVHDMAERHEEAPSREEEGGCPTGSGVSNSDVVPAGDQLMSLTADGSPEMKSKETVTLHAEEGATVNVAVSTPSSSSTPLEVPAGAETTPSSTPPPQAPTSLLPPSTSHLPSDDLPAPMSSSADSPVGAEDSSLPPSPLPHNDAEGGAPDNHPMLPSKGATTSENTAHSSLVSVVAPHPPTGLAAVSSQLVPAPLPPPVVSVPPPPPPVVSVPPPPPPVVSVPPPPPPVVSVPPPPPPVVSVPVPPPPTVPALSGASLSPPVPPSLEEQLAVMNAQINAQEAVLVEMIQSKRIS